REFVTSVVGAPALAALAGAAAAWLACAAVAGPGPISDRGRALLGLAAGGGAGLLVTAVALFAARAVTRAEIAEILRLVPRPGGAA
ncbi:MAG TPA: hypothetical protein VFX50_18935, partial [Gemmatimonadales bacterium]|nr:hypothetical protein [Gemmatimonadales bacterium]